MMPGFLEVEIYNFDLTGDIHTNQFRGHKRVKCSVSLFDSD